MKLKEGMYIRTKYNDFCNMVAIRKIDEFDDDGSFWIDDYIIDTYGDEQNKLREEDIELASEVIANVIKSGDFVDGCLVLDFETLQNGEKAIIVNALDSYGWGQGVIPVSEIKSIVTKEQFALMKYEVE